MNRWQIRVLIFRLLTAVQPEWFGPSLVAASVSLSTFEMFRGRSRAAVAAATEAVVVARRLADSTPDGRDLLLARALTRKATCEVDTTEHDAALADATAAIRLFERCRPARPALAAAGLVQAYGTLALVRQALGHRGEALAAARESVELCRRPTSVNCFGS